MRAEGRTASVVATSCKSSSPMPERALDIGCGAGSRTLALAERLGARTHVVGVDSRLGLVREAASRARHVALDVRFALGDPRCLPFADATFDLVRCRDLGDGDEPRLAVLEAARVTRIGSVVLFDEPASSAGRAEFWTALAFGARLELGPVERVGERAHFTGTRR